MSRVHPSSEEKNGCDNLDPLPVVVSSSPKYTTLTVWKRSSMSFQGTDGFTVYDRHGRLTFRVDNYSRKNGWSCSSLATKHGRRKGGAALVLMDGSGKPLLTLKSQIFSFQSEWNGCIYTENDNGSSKNDRTIFVMRRPSSTLLVFGRSRNEQAQCEAEVFFNHLTEPESNEGFKKSSPQSDYIIEGSFWSRNCKIRRTSSGEVAAKIIRKRTGTPEMVLSEEVFSLVVNPGFDPQLIMAFVVILDRICLKPFYTPFMCS